MLAVITGVLPGKLGRPLLSLCEEPCQTVTLDSATETELEPNEEDSSLPMFPEQLCPRL